MPETETQSASSWWRTTPPSPTWSPTTCAAPATRSLQEHNGRAGLQTALTQRRRSRAHGPHAAGIGRDGGQQRDRPAQARTSRSSCSPPAASARRCLEGFESGADDYITKPFDIEVLLARIQARLRRAPAGVAVRWCRRRRDHQHGRPGARPRHARHPHQPRRGAPEPKGARPARASPLSTRTPLPPRGDRGTSVAP